MTLSDIAGMLRGQVVGDAGVEISGLAKIEEAEPGEITFLSNPKYSRHLTTTRASAVLVARGSDNSSVARRGVPIQLVEVDDPYLAFLTLVEYFHPPADLPPRSVHESAVVPATARLGSNVSLGAFVVLGERCTIGDNAVLYPGTVLHEGVEIGNDTMIYANVTVRERCRIGARCVIHSGTVIGSDGFGFAPKPDGTYEKIPQRGIVVIEDDVEVGANCAIDRATIGETRIKRGVKLDNLIQIAHNVEIAEHTVIAALTGISGSTKIGAFSRIGGQVGFAGHLRIAEKTQIAAQSGVAKSITEAGRKYFGSPAKEIGHAFRVEAALNQLPELVREVRELRRKLDESGAVQQHQPSEKE